MLCLAVLLLQALVSDLSEQLAGATGLRVLRLPHLSRAAPHTYEVLEAQMPNCLIVQADETVLTIDVIPSASAWA